MAEKLESGLKYAICIDATILKNKVAGFIEGGNGTEVLILPKEVEALQTLDFQTLLKEVARQFHLPEEEITTAIKGIQAIFPDFNPEDLTFQLNQIFFHYKKKGTGAETAEDPASFMEYAFSIKINLGKALELAGILSIETLYLAIWNTKLESVLKQFKMADISALLPG